MKKKHILWINERADFTGGCEKYIFDTVSMLNKQGFSSSIMYSVGNCPEHEFIKVFKYAFPVVDPERQIKEINPDIIYIHKLENIKFCSALLNTGKPIIRFYHDHSLFCLRVHKYTLLQNRTCTKPIGLNCYSCLGFINRSTAFPGIKVNFLNKLKKEQEVNKKFNAFIVGSQYMKEHLKLHGFPEDKINVIPLYSTIFPESSNSKDRDDKTLVFAGQLVRGKGIDNLLNALSKVKNRYRLVICGTGKQEHEFKELAKKLGIDKNIEFKGKLNHQELKEVYKKSYCAVATSRAPETFYLSGLEAMAFGIPVIGVNAGGIGEWLKNGVNGLMVPNNDIDALSKAIDEILANKQMAEKFGKNGQKIFVEEFNSAIHIEKLKGILSDLT